MWMPRSVLLQTRKAFSTLKLAFLVCPFGGSCCRENSRVPKREERVMTRLNSQQILVEKKSRDPTSITALILNQKALTDVSCLKDFKNLEKLDLGFNNLSSLEGLSSCISLKWLSVVQNKLRSLKGIEGLCKLTVLNAGKNKLSSLDEVSRLIALRALILNDNEISSVCKLDELKELNTLVLSRNPIRDLGKSLIKVKSITKLSLSHCQLQTIGSSLVSLVDVKEVRLSHNEISTLPTELAHNTRLLTLDLGNNFITNWSELKVLSSLLNLRSLNLQGNPIADHDKLAKKVKKLVPNLQIFNNRPLERGKENEKDVQREEPSNNEMSRKRVSNQSNSVPLDNDTDTDIEKGEVKRKKSKADKMSKKDVSSGGGSDDVIVEKELNKKKPKRMEESKLDPIDDGETSFMDLIISSSSKNPRDGNREKKVQDTKSLDGLVTYPAKRMKKPKKSEAALLLLSSQTAEVGMGGPSTWDA